MCHSPSHVCHSLSIWLSVSCRGKLYYLRSCPICHTSMPVTLAEQLYHQSTCAISEAKSKNALKTYFCSRNQHETVYYSVCVLCQFCLLLGLQPSSPVEEPPPEYFCQECGETFNLTSTDILKHKRKHKRSQT